MSGTKAELSTIIRQLSKLLNKRLCLLVLWETRRSGSLSYCETSNGSIIILNFIKNAKEGTLKDIDPTELYR